MLVLSPDLPSEPSDAEVIARVVAGDRAAFGVLVRRYNQPAYRACRAVLRDDHEAEDAVQTAWLAAFRALPSFRAEASFRTWITRIAVNEASARLRTRRRLHEVSEQLPDVPFDEPPPPDRVVFDKEIARLLERELDELPEGLRSVIVLRDVIELDTAETAACLGIAPENVRVRLHRARQTLASRLGGAFDPALPDVWRFDGARCAAITQRVMTSLPCIVG